MLKREIALKIPKVLLFGSLALFCVIAGSALLKKSNRASKQRVAAQEARAQKEVPISLRSEPPPPTQQELLQQNLLVVSTAEKSKSTPKVALASKGVEDLPSIDRVFQLFTTGQSKLPIVETLTYQSSVPWLKGRPAWVADYAVYFGTSRHFIARSLNGKPDYFSQKVTEGSRFNVFKKDKNVQFWLLVDLSHCKMGFYYLDLGTNERVLLKTYQVGLGRLDTQKPGGTLTPVGRYSLGKRVAIYQPGIMGFHQDKQVEMMRVFGTRWLPFEEELERFTAPAKGYGIQGLPWIQDSKTAQLYENRECLGKYDSDGCIRMRSEDIEELFAIVISKPTYVEIVSDLKEARLPGVEVAVPTR
jgi:hypothetical protein